MSVFDKKNWNSQVFQKYLETVPRVKQNALLKSGVLRTRSDLKNRLADQVGGNYINIPITGRIGGNVINYDGNTNITATGLGTYLQSAIVLGRAKAWQEYDFTQEITGKNFMEEVAAQVSDYWDDIDQADLLAVLAGVFGVTTNNFQSDHTLDLTTNVNAADKYVGAASLNNAIQKAAGANKNIFTMVVMHSVVATNLENLKLLEYLKNTDSEGIQRDLSLATWNGRRVLIDDDVPVTNTETTAGVYTVTIGGTLTSSDKFKIAGVGFTTGSTSAATAATAAATAINGDTTVGAIYTAAATSGGSLTLTEKSGHYGTGEPAVSVVSSAAGTIGITTTTPAVLTPNYTTYILGQNAIDYCDCGVKVPSETRRDELTAGGVDMLITRQRHLLAPIGFSYVTTSKVSPETSDLANSSNWALVTDTDSGYFPSKAIPLARIISLG